MAAQRVWQALKERRGALLFLALFWALVFFVLQPLSQQRYDALCLQHEQLFSLPESDDTVQLTGGITLVQTFRPEKDCRGLSLRVATYRRTNSARITFFLMDEQMDVLFSQDQDSAAWPDNGYVSLSLPQPLKAGEEYSLLIFSAEGPDGLNPGLHLLNGLGEGDQPLERNGQLLAFSLQLAATVEHPQVYTLYTALLIWLVVGSLALALLLRQADERGFLWYALLVGWLVALLLPFPDERDEGTHFFKAVALTEGKLEEMQDELIGCELPQGTLAPFSLRLLAASDASDWPGPLEGEKEFIALSYVANVIPLEHAVLALPVALLRALGAPLWLTVFLSRLWCYALYTALCWAAIRRAGRFKPIFFVVALLPFAQRMAGLVSTDPLLLGGALLFTATVLRLWQGGQEGQPRTLSGWDMASLLLSALLLSSVKYLGYAPMLALLWAVPRDCWRSRRQRVILGGALALMLLALAIWQLALLQRWPYTEDRSGDTDIARQLASIGEDPVAFLRVLADYCFTILLGFRFLLPGKALLTNLENLLAGLALILAPMLCADGRQCAKDAQGKSRRLLRALCFALFALISLINMVSLYLSYTPVGSSTIVGLQTRYFIPQTLLLLVGLSLALPQLKPRRGSSALAMLPVTLGVITTLQLLMELFG